MDFRRLADCSRAGAASLFGRQAPCAPFVFLVLAGFGHVPLLQLADSSAHSAILHDLAAVLEQSVAPWQNFDRDFVALEGRRGEFVAVRLAGCSARLQENSISSPSAQTQSSQSMLSQRFKQTLARGHRAQSKSPAPWTQASLFCALDGPDCFDCSECFELFRKLGLLRLVRLVRLFRLRQLKQSKQVRQITESQQFTQSQLFFDSRHSIKSPSSLSNLRIETA